MSSVNEPNQNNETGRTWWRSLDEAVATEETMTTAPGEFPEGASDLLATGDDRRQFLKIMGASMALAGLGVGGCRRWPKEHIVPYAHRPQGTMPGNPEYYASCFDFGGIAQGVLVTSNDGRPTKIEGNPMHSGSKGATDAFTQASILDLYDPDRSKRVTYGGEVSSMSAFKDWAVEYLPKQGKGTAVICEPSSSPTFHRMQRAFMKKNPHAIWVEYAPLTNTNEREALDHAFGGHWVAVPDFSKAKNILSIDADFLGAGPMQVQNTQGWSAGRKVHHGAMSRLLMFETGLSITGSKADDRFALSPAELLAVAELMAFNGTGISTIEGSAELDDEIVQLLKDEFGTPDLVVVGASQPVIVHSLAAKINERIGAVGNTVSYRQVANGSNATLSEVVAGMKDGRVTTAVIVGGNPAFDAPQELGFAEALEGLNASVCLSYYNDETSQACKWHVNQAHWLEAWNDGTAADGTTCIGQPLIEALFGGLSASEFVAILAGEKVTDSHTLVQTTFNPNSDKWDPAWRTAVHDGVVANTKTIEKPPVNRKEMPLVSGVTASAQTVLFTPSPTVWDGRFANNGWMQELPDTLTKLTWDNAVLLSPATARALDVKQGDMLRIEVGGASIEIAALPVPGTADDCFVLPLGYGRKFEGRVCKGAGVDAYPLRNENMWSAPAKVTKTGTTYPLATTQMHFAVDTTPGKGAQDRMPLLYREGTLDQYNKDPGFVSHIGHVPHSLSIYEEHQFEGAKYKWGMSIDLSTCTGCNSCVAACHAENNIPIVGKDQVLVGREMHWLRIDRYFAFAKDSHGAYDGDKLESVAIQPVTCHHCENAPCEEVCPVAATVHDIDGLNVMVYNRCVGTRYCSNNCPFKVRRFNYFDYFRRDPLRSTGLLQVQPDYYVKTQSGGKTLRAMQFNPDVTVRMRGVMEKCTFCTQRIQRVKIATKNAWVKKTDAQKKADPRVAIPDGSIVTACQQACPADAIVFGDLLDEKSRVSKLHKEKRSYEMLEELNIKSRLKYLARLTNPVHGATVVEGAHH